MCFAANRPIKQASLGTFVFKSALSMKNIAPEIKRQRLLMEGYYSIDVNREVIIRYFENITGELRLKMYGDPIIFSPQGEGKKINQGYDAFVPLIDSGISLYVWTEAKFFSVIVYTCKDFKNEKAIEVTQDFFKAKNVESMDF